MKVLIVDPDAARAASIAEALNGTGALPAVAPSASFALTMLEWNQQDVIISRAQVGDMDGHELCTMVRADPSTTGVRFVLITSDMTPAQTMQTGIDLVIPEGLIGAAIVTRVMNLMRREPSSAAATPVAPAVAPAPPPPATLEPSPPPAPALEPPPPPAPTLEPPPPAPAPSVVAAPAASAPVEPPAPLPATVPPPAASPLGAGPALKGAAPPPPPLTELDGVGMNGAMRTFQGALGSLSLEDLAQALVKGSKTGRLLLVLGTGGGMIAFEAGRIVHAEVGNTTGETAFQSLVGASQRETGGKFCFIPSAPRDLANVPKTITRTVAELLNGAAQAMNEER